MTSCRWNYRAKRNTNVGKTGEKDPQHHYTTTRHRCIVGGSSDYTTFEPAADTCELLGYILLQNPVPNSATWEYDLNFIKKQTPHKCAQCQTWLSSQNLLSGELSGWKSGLLQHFLIAFDPYWYCNHACSTKTLHSLICSHFCKTQALPSLDLKSLYEIFAPKLRTGSKREIVVSRLSAEKGRQKQHQQLSLLEEIPSTRKSEKLQPKSAGRYIG